MKEILSKIQLALMLKKWGLKLLLLELPCVSTTIPVIGVPILVYND